MEGLSGVGHAAARGLGPLRYSKNTPRMLSRVMTSKLPVLVPIQRAPFPGPSWVLPTSELWEAGDLPGSACAIEVEGLAAPQL